MSPELHQALQQFGPQLAQLQMPPIHGRCHGLACRRQSLALQIANLRLHNAANSTIGFR